MQRGPYRKAPEDTQKQSIPEEQTLEYQLAHGITLGPTGRLFREGDTISFRPPNSNQDITLDVDDFIKTVRLGKGFFGKAYRIDYTGQDQHISSLTRPMSFAVTSDNNNQSETQHLLALKAQQHQGAQAISEFAREQGIVDAISDRYFQLPENQRPEGINIGRSITIHHADGTQTQAIISRFEGTTVENQIVSMNGEDFFKKLFHPYLRSQDEKSLFRNFENQKEIFIMQFLKSLHDAMSELHKLDFLHLDLSLRNVFIELIQNQGQIIGIKATIGDFGFAQHLDGQTTIQTSTDTLPLLSTDPLSIESGTRSKKSDIFSFKIMMHEIMAEVLDIALDNIVSSPSQETNENEARNITQKTENHLQWYRINLQRASDYSDRNDKNIVTTFIDNFTDYLSRWRDPQEDTNLFNEIYQDYFIKSLQALISNTKANNPAELQTVYHQLQALLLMKPDQANYSQEQNNFIAHCEEFSKLDPNKLNQAFKDLQQLAKDSKNLLTSTRDQLDDAKVRFDAIVEYYSKQEITADNYRRDNRSRNIMDVINLEKVPNDIIKQLHNELEKLKSYPNPDENRAQELRMLIEGQIKAIEAQKQIIWRPFSAKFSKEKKQIVDEKQDTLEKQLALFESIVSLAKDNSKDFNRIHLATAFALMKSIPKLAYQIKEISGKELSSDLIKRIENVKKHQKTFDSYRDKKKYIDIWKAIDASKKQNLRWEQKPNVILANQIIETIYDLQKKKKIAPETPLRKILNSQLLQEQFPGQNIKDVLALAALADPSLGVRIADMNTVSQKKSPKVSKQGILSAFTSTSDAVDLPGAGPVLPTQVRKQRQ